MFVFCLLFEKLLFSSSEDLHFPCCQGLCFTSGCHTTQLFIVLHFIPLGSFFCQLSKTFFIIYSLFCSFSSLALSFLCSFPYCYFPSVSLILSIPFRKECIHIAYFSPSGILPQASFPISIPLSSHSLAFFVLVFFFFSLISPSSAPTTITDKLFPGVPRLWTAGHFFQVSIHSGKRI